MADAQSSKKSALADLRQFRLQKPKLGLGSSSGSNNRSATHTTSSNSKSKPTTEMKVRRRIQVASDSDSDCAPAEATAKRAKVEISVAAKEQRFAALMKIAPHYDTVHLQSALVNTNWDVSEAQKYLKANFQKKASSHSPAEPAKSTKSGSINGSSHLNKNKRKKNKSDSEDSYSEKKDLVYDSEDSDGEHKNSSRMTSQRQNVFDYLNTATAKELLDIKTCSEKKVEAIVRLRPFSSWKDLCKKIVNEKGLSTDVLNNCQDLLNKQTNVAKIMKKCTKLVKTLETAIANGAGIVEQPRSLNNSFKLAEYQLVGLNWMAVMHKQKMNGILADEMGLGKTIQVIAFLTYLKEQNLESNAHLIVVPSSTLDNWENEFAKWSPSLVVQKYHGSQAERRSMRVKYAKEGFKGIDVMLSTYSVVGSTPEDRKMFKTCAIGYVVFDEAHMLKNMTSQRYCNLITINAKYRLLLTGTPLQNNLLELMSLLCFVMPSFFAKTVDDLKSLFQKKSKMDEKESAFEKSQVEQAKEIMKPFILRRLKKDVLQFLPKKTEIVKKLEMHPEQKTMYKDIIEHYSHLSEQGRFDEGASGIAILMKMRKLANHPLLMRYYFTEDMLRPIARRLAAEKSYKKSSNAEHILEDIVWLSDFQIMQTCHKHGLDDVDIPDELVLQSGKFAELDVLLPKLRDEGHRVLIFSQFTMMLDIMERYMDIREFGFMRLDGQTAVEDRQDMINQFNSDPDIFIFLLSTKAGGVGINLTAADVGIIHDIDFNPYNDKQAADRCHRMGQTKPVTIYRFVSEGTIEEGMLMIADEKLKLEEEIHSDEKDVVEHKSVVRLLTMSLKWDESKAEESLSPQKAANGNVIPRLHEED